MLVLDGDEAGTKRANEVLELFVAQQVDLRILTLPDDLDPCDFLHEQGGRGVSPNCWPTRRSTPWTTPSEAKTRGIDLERDVHGASQALERVGGDRGQGAAAAARHHPRQPASAKRRFCSVWPRDSASTKPKSAAS